MTSTYGNHMASFPIGQEFFGPSQVEVLVGEITSDDELLGNDSATAEVFRRVVYAALEHRYAIEYVGDEVDFDLFTSGLMQLADELTVSSLKIIDARLKEFIDPENRDFFETAMCDLGNIENTRRETYIKRLNAATEKRRAAVDLIKAQKNPTKKGN